MKTTATALSALILASTSGLALADSQGLTEADIKAAQQAWGDALVAIALLGAFHLQIGNALGDGRYLVGVEVDVGDRFEKGRHDGHQADLPELIHNPFLEEQRIEWLRNQVFTKTSPSKSTRRPR